MTSTAYDPHSEISERSAQLQSESLEITLPDESVLQRRFHVVTGKGGVGKSTVCATLGMALAMRGQKTLICEVDDRNFFSQAFQSKKSRGHIEPLSIPLWSGESEGARGALSAVNIQFDEALSEYGMLKLKVKALSSLFVENPLTRSLLSLVPGVSDLVALGKAFHHERQKDERGHAPLWDRVIIDAPSTGHGISFLSLPRVIQRAVPFGNLRREADEMWTLLSAPHRAAVHLVTTTEEMPAQETLELYQTFCDDLEIYPQALWVNRNLPALFSPPLESDERVTLERVRHVETAELSSLWTLLDRAQTEIDLAQKNLAPLKRLPMSHAQIPQVAEQRSAALIKVLSNALQRHSLTSRER
jgi:hypothetical protein